MDNNQYTAKDKIIISKKNDFATRNYQQDLRIQRRSSSFNARSDEGVVMGNV